MLVDIDRELFEISECTDCPLFLGVNGNREGFETRIPRAQI